MFRSVNVIRRLKIEPELLSRVEKTSEQYRSLGRDAALLKDDIVDSRCWYVQFLSQLVSRHFQRNEKFFFQNLAGMYLPTWVLSSLDAHCATPLSQFQCSSARRTLYALPSCQVKNSRYF